MWNQLINFGINLLMQQMIWATMRKAKVCKEILNAKKRIIFRCLGFLGFLDDSHAVRDTPIVYQLYKHIESSKEVGVSEAEATVFLGQSKLNGRALVKSVTRTSAVDFYIANQGRQIVKR